MLTSKIIKQTIDNLFQFDLDKSWNYLWKDTFAPIVPVSKCQGGNTTALWRPCLPLSTITASLHYSTCQDDCVQESHAPKWTFENLLPCY